MISIKAMKCKETLQHCTRTSASSSPVLISEIFCSFSSEIRIDHNEKSVTGSNVRKNGIDIYLCGSERNMLMKHLTHGKVNIIQLLQQNCLGIKFQWVNNVNKRNIWSYLCQSIGTKYAVLFNICLLAKYMHKGMFSWYDMTID